MSMMQPRPVPTDCRPGAVVLCAEEHVRDIVAHWLDGAATRVHVAADGADADRALRDPTVHLLVTDRVLPPWPGLSTFMQLRALNPRLRVAFVDNGSLDDRILARVTGASHVLSQPLRRQEVIDALPRQVLTAV
jgi:DNA-binding response OmpR family regulator